MTPIENNGFTIDSKKNTEQPFLLTESTRERLADLNWSNEEIRYINDIVEDLRDTPGCHKIWLYGSMARGDQDQKANQQSDIDLAVEIEVGLNPKDMFREDIYNEGYRDVQVNFFPIGFDEKTRDAIDESDAGYVYDEETGESRAVFTSDYVTRRASQDARDRLEDQIVLWQKNE